MNDDIIDVACALRKRTSQPKAWGENMKEAERRTRASFISVFGGSSQGVRKPTATASAPKADKVQCEVAKAPQVAPAAAPASESTVSGGAAPAKTAEPAPKKTLQAKNIRRKGGAK